MTCCDGDVVFKIEISRRGAHCASVKLTVIAKPKLKYAVKNIVR